MNTLFFASAIFTVKLRKPRTTSILPAFVYHLLATVIVFFLWYLGVLSPFTCLAFSVLFLKLLVVRFFLNWYQQTDIKNVALLETTSALLFLAVAAISVLPSQI
ncbi:MAG: hypothetical protein RML10_07450 [Geminocystis sp.]|nr:hypothetical protein [Geminocystis sp.]MDW8463414.1 hypothetical protein [Geminocystis sp.]